MINRSIYILFTPSHFLPLTPPLEYLSSNIMNPERTKYFINDSSELGVMLVDDIEFNDVVLTLSLVGDEWIEENEGLLEDKFIKHEKQLGELRPDQAEKGGGRVKRRERGGREGGIYLTGGRNLSNGREERNLTSPGNVI